MKDLIYSFNSNPILQSYSLRFPPIRFPIGFRYRSMTTVRNGAVAQSVFDLVFNRYPIGDRSACCAIAFRLVFSRPWKSPINFRSTAIPPDTWDFRSHPSISIPTFRRILAWISTNHSVGGIKLMWRTGNYGQGSNSDWAIGTECRSDLSNVPTNVSAAIRRIYQRREVHIRPMAYSSLGI